METIRIETAGGMVIAPNWEAVAKLYAKIGKAASKIGAVAKDKKNAHFGYQYVSYEQTAAEVRAAFEHAGLAFSIGSHSPEMAGDLCTLHVEGSIVDTETGAMRIMYGVGQGKDNQDKAAAKALTSGVKYLLMRALLFSDSEADADADAPATRTEGKPAEGNGNGDKPEPPEWLNAFWGWYGKFAENQGLTDNASKRAAYEWMKANGHMLEHLAMYSAQGAAQTAAMKGMAAYVQARAKEAA